jgi:glycosyltransferase involved in cell wall biosynthesis
VLASAVDAVLVLDTGSTDQTLAILASYPDGRIEVVQHHWNNSFADARNAVMERARPGWVVFLDADEWLTEDTAKELRACLDSFESVPGMELAALAPTIREAAVGEQYEDIPRIMPNWSLRFHGEVHEYPFLPGLDAVPGTLGVSLEFMHDGYRPDVAVAKDKRRRNLALIERARAAEPRNPRWLFYQLRDGLWEMSGPEIVDLCTQLADADRSSPGDRVGPEVYRRNGVAHACTRLAQLGDWRQALTYCVDLDRMSPPVSPDAVYVRGLHELLKGSGATPHGLLTAVRTRNGANDLTGSGLDADGRHLDALIAAYLRDLKGREVANDYLAMCRPWSDPFFDASRLRH